MSYGCFKCIVCHFVAATIAELHKHQTSSHSTEQLSLSIIQLQNLVKSNKENFDSPCQYNILFRDAVDIINKEINKDVNFRRKYEEFEEQNEPLCLKKPKAQVLAIKEELDLEQKAEESSNLFADIRIQEMFLSWELELNKPLEISEDDFFRTIDILCKDLNNPHCRAPKRFRKPKTILVPKKKRIKSKHGKKSKASHHTKSFNNSNVSNAVYNNTDIDQNQTNVTHDHTDSLSNENIKYEKNEMTYSDDIYRKNEITEIPNFYNDNMHSDPYLFVSDINVLFDNISEDFSMNSSVSQAFPNTEFSNSSIIMSNDNQVSLLKL